ncbi:deoxyribonuclease IV [Patescibacteria group bacterium]|nr:deoxyribonuclease IV [Patescibacteria group bacterium]
MLIGCHVSIAGGISNAPLNAGELGCEVFQCFSRSPQGGPAPVLTDEEVGKFLTNCEKNHLKQWVLHAPYYINFASGVEGIRTRSAQIIRDELERGTKLRADYAMFHPGSAKDVGREKGLTHVVEGVKKVLDGYNGTTKLLVEISAGAGEVIGDTFEEIAEILNRVDHPDLGVCFDTEHAFASGYDLRDAKHVREVFLQFDKLIGLDRLKMSHCNDSKIELGGHKDRHEHIGKGFIGKAGFEAMFAEPLLQKINWFLETEHDSVKNDIDLLKEIRGK